MWTLLDQRCRGWLCRFFVLEIHVRWQGLILSVVHHGAIEVAPALATERLVLFVGQLLVQSAQETLIVNAHGLQEAHFELLAVSAELGSQSVPLALQFFL